MDDFARFFDNSLDLNGIANAEGYFRRVNIAWERTLGWTAPEISASPWLDFVHPDDRQAAIDAGQRLLAGESVTSFENRYRCKDGRYRLIQWHVESVGGEAYCSGRDVTEERSRPALRANLEGEDGLRERGPWFFAIFDSAPFAMALTTMPEGVTVSVNNAFLDFFEVARHEVVGRTSLDLGIADPESRARLAAELRDRGTVRDFECVRRTRSGARVTLLLNLDPITVEGASYVFTSVRDITSASTAAAELRALVDNLPELAWTARPDGFIDFYNRRWYEYTGTTYEEMQGWGWQSVHDPNELPRVMAGWTRSIATRQPFDQTFPLRRKDGMFRWFLTRVAPMFDDGGELVRWVGINTDVDDQRRDQEALLEIAAVIESADDAIITDGLDGRIRSWNPGATRLLGYGAEEMVGQSVMRLVPEDRTAEELHIRGRIRAEEHVRHLETVRKKKDGSLVDVSLTVSPVHDNGGGVVGASRIMRDVTARNQGEQERVRLVVQLQALNVDLEERVRSRTAELSKTLEERESLLREKTSLLQEVHHRVKNNLQMISSLLNLQARQIKDEETRGIFLESQARVRSIAILHESLYQSKDLGRIDMKQYIDKLVGTLIRTYKRSARVVAEVESLQLPVDLAVPCGLIVNELVTNALKHAFPEPHNVEGNEIHIAMRRDDDDVTLLVSDNGSGFGDAVDPTRAETMGLALVRDLSLQLRGVAEFATANGARCTIRFPAPRDGARS